MEWLPLLRSGQGESNCPLTNEREARAHWHPAALPCVAPFTPGSRRTKGSTSRSIRSMPSARQPRPSSTANATKAGRPCLRSTTTVASPARTWTGRRCNGCWAILNRATRTAWWSTRSTVSRARCSTSPGSWRCSTRAGLLSYRSPSSSTRQVHWDG